MTATSELTRKRAVELEQQRQQKHYPNRGLRFDNSDQSLALRAAVAANDRDEVIRLLDAGADFVAADDNFQTPVAYAAARGLIEMLQLLLDRGAPADTPSQYNASPLISAVENNQMEAARILLENGAEPNRNRGYFMSNTIMSAVKNGNAPILRLLLEHGADPCVTGTNYRSSLTEAEAQGRTDLVEMLLDAISDVDAPGDTIMQMPLLTAAAHCNDVVTIQRLLDRGADPEKRDYLDKTPLAHAAEQAAKDALKLLIALGASIETRSRCECTPLMLAASTFGLNPSDQAKTLRELIAAGANIGAQDEFGCTALHHAARAGNAVCAETLLDAGAEIEIAATSGWTSGRTPLMEAALSWRDDAVLDLLLARGAKPDGAGKRGFTPLMATMEYCREAAATTLLDAGADPNACDWRGKTALMFATQFGRKNMMHLLISRGADVNATDKQGKTVLDYATKGKKTRSTLVAILQQAGAK